MLHNYKECENCGKTFLKYRDSKFCPECRKELEEKFNKVKEYIYERPGANIAEISDFTKVEEKKILKWIDKGRLVKTLKPSLRCEVCGIGINTGRLCKKCLDGLKPDSTENLENTNKNYRGLHISEKNKI